VTLGVAHTYATDRLRSTANVVAPRLAGLTVAGLDRLYANASFS
jgi:hypothetical protein